MTALAELDACFEGVIPSVISTVAADGTPNVSYLSQVVAVDENHVALSNQYFSKTAQNIRENPHAALLLVDADTGAQFRLDITYVESRDGGEAFDRVKSNLDAASAQIGVPGIFRLRALDIYRVETVVPVLSPVTASETVPLRGRLADAARAVEAVGAEADTEGVVEALLNAVVAHFGYENALLLLADHAHGTLTTIASRGYGPSGIGSEVPFGEGLIGSAAAEGRAMHVSDVSRVRRFADAVRASSDEENQTRTVALPGMADARSQIAIPMMAQRTVRGVLFVESGKPFAFRSDDETALAIVASAAALALTLAENVSEDAPAESTEMRSRAGGPPFKVTHHVYDDSVFIDEQYVIKGVAGRLLTFMLSIYARDGRCDFTNRELRLAPALRLPDVKDNLETRLLLLRRRLDEKGSPVRLVRKGRGRVALEVTGEPRLERVREAPTP
jgi:adenylate cyclase